MKKKPWPLPEDTDFRWVKGVNENEIRAAAIWELARHDSQICDWSGKVSRQKKPLPSKPSQSEYEQWATGVQAVNREGESAKARLLLRDGKYKALAGATLFCGDSVRSTPWRKVGHLDQENFLRVIAGAVSPLDPERVQLCMALARQPTGKNLSPEDIKRQSPDVKIEPKPLKPEPQTVAFTVDWRCGKDAIAEAFVQWVGKNAPLGTPKSKPGNRRINDAKAILDYIEIVRRVKNGEEPAAIAEESETVQETGETVSRFGTSKIKQAEAKLNMAIRQWFGEPLPDGW